VADFVPQNNVIIRSRFALSHHLIKLTLKLDSGSDSTRNSNSTRIQSCSASTYWPLRCRSRRRVLGYNYAAGISVGGCSASVPGSPTTTEAMMINPVYSQSGLKPMKRYPTSQVTFLGIPCPLFSAALQLLRFCFDQLYGLLLRRVIYACLQRI